MVSACLFSSLSRKNDSLRVIERVLSEIDPLRDKDGFDTIEVGCVAGFEGAVSTSLIDSASLWDFVDPDRSELVTRITGSTLFAAMACSRYGEAGSLCFGSLCFEFFDVVSTLRCGLF